MQSLPIRTLVAVALSATAVLSACSKHEAMPEPVRAVRVQEVAPQALNSQREFSGDVRSRVESNLGFRVAGKIVRRSVELGQTVKAGQVLAQIDAQDYRLATDAAKAQLTAAQVNLDIAQADIQRFRELRKQNFISAAELDRREGSLKAAQAQRDQAQAQMSNQSNQVGYTTLVADAPGVVTAVMAEVGQVVGAGTPVIQIAQSGARDAVFAVPEDWVKRLHVGATVQVKLWNSSETNEARVREIAAAADPVTRTFAIKATLPASVNWSLGSTVSVLPQQDAAAASVAVTKLPTTALLESGGKTVVWVLDKSTMTLHQTPVQIAGADGNGVVIQSGLQPGALVVTAGVHVLTEGQKVTIYQQGNKS